MPAAVKRAVEIASQSGAKRAVILPVSAPFHCALMEPAQKRLEQDLRAAQFHALQFPLITNVDAEAITTGDEAREALIRQVTAARALARFRARDDRMRRHRLRRSRPGKVLTGLLRQIDRSVRCFNVEDSASLQSTLEKLAQARAEVREP